MPEMKETRDKEDLTFRILVVDDNQDAADSLSTLLRLSGFAVRTFYHGEEALEGARTFLPHCILSDIGLPGIDGYSLAARLRQDESLRHISLIAITAYPDTEKAKAAGFDHHLLKPADPVIVEEIVKELRDMGKRLERSEQLVQQQGKVVNEARDLIKEVKGDLKEVKSGMQTMQEEIREVKEDVKEIKEELQQVKENGKDT
jgi:CheY-like chemotaxis protein